MSLVTRVRPRARTRQPEGDRTIISDADRRRPAVRVGLGATQVVILVGLVITGLGPLLWLLKSSVSTTQDILREPFAIFPSGVVQLENFAIAWDKARIGQFLGNTAVIALGTTVTTLFVCLTAAYLLSVLRPRWGPALNVAIMATLFIPGVIALVPLYLTVLDLPILNISLINNYLAIWLPAGANAFLILVVKRFFDAIPRELFEAARIDGAGAVRVFVLVVLPLSRPIIGVVALLTVMASWKDFLWPLLVIPNPTLQPISVALSKIADTTPLNVQIAALFLALIVPVGLFLIFQKQFLAGVGMAGGTKG